VSGRLQVVAGFIVENDRVLLAQRLLDDAFPGMWECPGGKLEPGEDMWEALQREMAEELGLDIKPRPEGGEPFYMADFYTPLSPRDMDVHFIACRLGRIKPTAIEAAGFGWFQWKEACLMPGLVAGAVALFDHLERTGRRFDGWRSR
jgi:mutator protein MutT